MELNNYQKQVMRDLSAYLDCVNRGTNLFSAWREYWFSKDVAVGLGGVPSYNNSIERAPHVCMKVPTGGGKTFMAFGGFLTPCPPESRRWWCGWSPAIPS